MSEGGRRARRTSPLRLLLCSFLLTAGCGVLSFGGGQVSRGAHTVFLARDGCAAFVARTLGQDFLLAETADAAYVPAVGDVLEGPTRVGPSVFALYPAGAAASGTPSGPPTATVPLDVHAVGLPLGEARARLDAACGPAR
ncbi:MAG TPA: hypothetical protein VK002_10220 [Rubricoccaceae bacterium]|nr:hypothetical protein [Rubricoccaceae bacterium]